MTKDAEEFSQFDGHVACREYILPRDDESSNEKVGFVAVPRLDLC